MSAWQDIWAELYAENTRDLKTGKYANGYELFKAKRAENFGVSTNNAVRQFANFSQAHPVEARMLSDLVQFKHSEADLRDYTEAEKELILGFIWVAKKMAPHFTAPITKRDFYQAVHHNRGL